MATQKASQAIARDEENERLVELVRAYRTSGKNRREENALHSALLDKMRPMAAQLAYEWGMTADDAQAIIDEIERRWEGKKELLFGWREDGGAAVSTWLYKALGYARRDIREKQKKCRTVPFADAANGDDNQAPREDELPSSDKSPYTPIRLSQLAMQIQAIVRELPGRQFFDKDGESVRLTDNHALVLSTFLQHQCPSDQELAVILRIPKATVGRWRREAFAYVAQHRSRDDLLALMVPFSSEYQPGLDSAPAI